MSDEVRLWGGRFGAGPGGRIRPPQLLAGGRPAPVAAGRGGLAGPRPHARARGGSSRAADAAAIDAGLAQVARGARLRRLRLPRGGRGHPHGRRAAPDRARRRRRAPPPHGAQPQRPGRSPTRCCTCASTRPGRSPACAAWPRRCSPRPRPTSTRCCPATRTASAPSPCAWRTTCWPTSGCWTATARRLGHAIEATAECPLGSGALSGVGFPIDREQTAAELGFARPSPQQPRRGGQPRRPHRLPALRRPARRAPVAPGRRDRDLGGRRDRLRRPRRRLHLRLVDAPAEEEPRRGRARAREGAAPGGRPRPASSGRCPGCRSPTTRISRRTRSTSSTRSTRSTCSCRRWPG